MLLEIYDGFYDFVVIGKKQNIQISKSKYVPRYVFCFPDSTILHRNTKKGSISKPSLLPN